MVASHPVQKERQLEEQINKNVYQHAMLRMHQACYYTEPHKQADLLQVCAACLCFILPAALTKCPVLHSILFAQQTASCTVLTGMHASCPHLATTCGDVYVGAVAFVVHTNTYLVSRQTCMNNQCFKPALLKCRQSSLQKALKTCLYPQEAFQLLLQAQAAEDVLFQAVKGPNAQRSNVPAAPLLLARSPTTITLTNRPFKLKSHVKAAYFAVFGKSFGAGVGLGMNSTSMELEGTGVQHPLGSRVTITGENCMNRKCCSPDRL